MQSISKTRIAPATAAAIVERAFGADAALAELQELTEGFFNAAYLLRLAGGRRCVLKIAPPANVPVLRYERNIIYAEVATIELVRAGTSVPAPAVLHFDDTCQLVGSPYFLMEYLPGVPLHHLRQQLSAAEQQPIDRAIGEYLREINAIGGAAFGYAAPGAPRYACWKDAFLAMLDGVLADGQALGIALPRPYATLREQVARQAHALAPIGTPQLVHWDLWDGNIFVDPETRQISGVIDFERALWGDPLIEVQFRTAELPAGFAAGYGASPLEQPGAPARRVLYNIYLYLIMIIECTYRQFPTNDQELWAREQLGQELARLDAL